MASSLASWIRVSLLVGLIGAASCGSVSPLRPDGGGSGGAAGTTAGAGNQGGAGTRGGAGAQGGAGSQGGAGAQGGGGSTQDAAAPSDGPIPWDAAFERAPSCPATFTTYAEGATCPVASDITCEYPEGRCRCLECQSPTGGITQDSWSCRAWDSGGAGCPSRSPVLGSPCTTAGQFCTYGGICAISVGDNVECMDGTWKRMISPLGTCALRMCMISAKDAGAADHPPDSCTQATDCPGGTCWLQLDGSKACVKPRATPTLGTCQNGAAACCTKDLDCTQPNGGRCLPLQLVKQNFCGGAQPVGNVCQYDECRTDDQCKALAPAGAAVSACVPSGALEVFNATCVHGACRTDSDCVQHPGGRCRYGLAATHGVCSLRNVFYCGYPSDPCGNANSNACPGSLVCVPNDNGDGRQCGQGPPMYP